MLKNVFYLIIYLFIYAARSLIHLLLRMTVVFMYARINNLFSYFSVWRCTDREIDTLDSNDSEIHARNAQIILCHSSILICTREFTCTRPARGPWIPVERQCKMSSPKNMPSNGTLRQVVYRLKIQPVMLVFPTQLCELLPLNLLSGSTLPPSLPVSK